MRPSSKKNQTQPPLPAAVVKTAEESSLPEAAASIATGESRTAGTPEGVATSSRRRTLSVIVGATVLLAALILLGGRWGWYAAGVHGLVSFLRNNFDIIVFILLSIVHIGSWVEVKPGLSKDKPDFNERSLSATTLGASTTAGITAVSILIPASLLIVQIGLGDHSPLPPAAIDHVVRASEWFVASLSFGLLIIFLVPMKANLFNVARYFQIGILVGPQLITLWIGMIRLVQGLSTIAPSIGHR